MTTPITATAIRRSNLRGHLTVLSDLNMKNNSEILTRCGRRLGCAAATFGLVVLSGFSNNAQSAVLRSPVGNDWDCLITGGHQQGIALENLRLAAQVLTRGMSAETWAVAPAPAAARPLRILTSLASTPCPGPGNLTSEAE
jgi:hypothetical protein